MLFPWELYRVSRFFFIRKLEHGGEMYSTVASLVEDLTSASMSDAESVISTEMQSDPQDRANTGFKGIQNFNVIS